MARPLLPQARPGWQARFAIPLRKAKDGHEVNGAIHEELELAMLIDGAEAGNRRRAFTLLAKTFRPKLHIPGPEPLKPV